MEEERGRGRKGECRYLSPSLSLSIMDIAETLVGPGLGQLKRMGGAIFEENLCGWKEGAGPRLLNDPGIHWLATLLTIKKRH